MRRLLGSLWRQVWADGYAVGWRDGVDHQRALQALRRGRLTRPQLAQLTGQTNRHNGKERH